jgi:hypothetical protein
MPIADPYAKHMEWPGFRSRMRTARRFNSELPARLIAARIFGSEP